MVGARGSRWVCGMVCAEGAPDLKGKGFFLVSQKTNPKQDALQRARQGSCRPAASSRKAAHDLGCWMVLAHLRNSGMFACGSIFRWETLQEARHMDRHGKRQCAQPPQFNAYNCIHLTTVALIGCCAGKRMFYFSSGGHCCPNPWH